MAVAINRHRGQIPLWVAITLFGLLVLVVGIWTWRSTQNTTGDNRIPIVFWNAGRLGEGVYGALHDFELQNPQYKVIADTSASRDLTSDAQRLLCAIAGNVPPDLVWFDRFAIGEWASRGALTDLNPYLQAQKADDPDRIDLADYYSFTLNEARYRPPGTNGPVGLFGLPTSLDIRVLYSNADHLRQAGLVDQAGNPRPPQTWSELRADAGLLTRRNPDHSMARMGFSPDYGNSHLVLYAFQAGGNLLSEDGTRVTFDSPPVVRALRFVTDIYDDLGGYQAVGEFQADFQSNVLDPFLKGQVSMKIDGDGYMDEIIRQYKPDMDFIISPAPMPDDRLAQGAKPVTWAGGYSLVVPSTARNKQGAFKLMQFLSSRRTYRFLEEAKRQSDESQGLFYLPRPQGNRTLYLDRVRETLSQNPHIPAPFRRACAVLAELLPGTLIRPPSPVGQLLFNQQIRAFRESFDHKFAAEYSGDKDGEVLACLRDTQIVVQRQLDAILHPLPPTQVQWRGYFAGYAALAATPFIAIYVALRKSRRARVYRKGDTGAALLFLSPWLIGIICLTGGPILFSVVLSFTRYDVLSPARYVGLDNFRDLFQDNLFFKSLGNTAFMLLRVPLGMAISLAIALLLNRRIRGIGSYRTAFYMPTIVPLVAATLLWQMLLNDSFGLINVSLRWAFSTLPFRGVESIANHVHHFAGSPFHFTAPQWLDDPAWCKPAIILMGLWTAGGGMIIWLAGLQSIPAQLYEAATVDGAGKWKQFTHVTLPMLSPFILFNAIVGVIGTMQVFTEAYIMFPNGGNADAALFYAYYLFQKAFQYFSMGYASAMAWILFLIVLLLTLLQLQFSKKWVYYERT
ncbi:MAG: extracellular solute-binding protein [Tepidisphaeraceae bacterium]|jgi:multiple sugar transport system permease protein